MLQNLYVILPPQTVEMIELDFIPLDRSNVIPGSRHLHVHRAVPRGAFRAGGAKVDGIRHCFALQPGPRGLPLQGREGGARQGGVGLGHAAECQHEVDTTTFLVPSTHDFGTVSGTKLLLVPNLYSGNCN